MFSRNASRGVMVLVVVLFLVPAVAQAGGRGLSKGASTKPVASRVHEQGGVLQSLWHGLVGLFEKNGASIDPNGQPVTGTGTNTSGVVTGDNGASIDPSGAP
ncbi:MAG TPA: hypothetical protein VFC23_15430 [Thermoanaerobaculia bacterium]|nr:hypothetical protein [Thermoanaerobaculia bacterium]